MHSMKFNGQRKSFVKVLEKELPYWAPRNREVNTFGRKHVVQKTKTEPVPIKVTLLIDGDSKEDLHKKAEEVSEWLITREEKPLIFDDNKERVHWAILDGEVDVEEFVSFARVTVEFISVMKTGREKEITVKNKAGYFKIEGNEPTTWKSKTEFTGNTDKFEIKGAYGRNVTLNFDFVEGDVLEIDHYHRRVYLNEKQIPTAVSLKSDWFEVQPGYMQVEATQETKITYYERFH